jgi:hypothetical protein
MAHISTEPFYIGTLDRYKQLNGEGGDSDYFPLLMEDFAIRGLVKIAFDAGSEWQKTQNTTTNVAKKAPVHIEDLFTAFQQYQRDTIRAATNAIAYAAINVKFKRVLELHGIEVNFTPR